MKKEGRHFVVVLILFLTYVLILTSFISAITCTIYTPLHSTCYRNVATAYKDSNCQNGVGSWIDFDQNAYPLGCNPANPCDSNGHCSHYVWSHEPVDLYACGYTTSTTTCTPYYGDTINCTNGLAYKNYYGCDASTCTHLAAVSTRNSTYDSTCTTLGLTQWMDLTGQNISSSDLNDQVIMMTTGTGLSGMTAIKEIYNSSNSLIISKSKLAQSATAAYDFWNSSIAGLFYFNSTVGASRNISGNLTVSSQEINSLPNARIDFPYDGFNTTVNSSNIFNQSSSDVDDLLNITWDFGDNIRLSFLDYSSYLTPYMANTLHNYSTSGTYRIELNASESNRSQSDNDVKRIYVFERGINVIPVITSPIEGGSHDSGVAFDISQSYVVNCTIGAMTNYNFSVNNLNCSYIHSPGQIMTTGYNITVNWTFVYGNWYNNYSNVVKFARYYNSAGSHSEKLILNYSSGSFSKQTSLVVVFSTLAPWNCTVTGTDSFWVNGATRVNSSNNCTLHSNNLYSACCPSGYTCDSSSKCMAPTLYCSSFNSSRSSCESVGINSVVVINSLTDPSVCGSNYTNSTNNCNVNKNCLCLWSNNTCGPAYNVTTLSCPTTPPNPGLCSWTNAAIQNNCNSSLNNIVVSMKSNWTGDLPADVDCIDYAKTYQCPSTNQLPFFTSINLVITVLAISLVYFISLRKKK